MKWEDRIFQERAGAIKTPCRQCARTMWIPPSKIGQKATCSAECHSAWRETEYLRNVRDCATCGRSFRPRGVQLAAGGGRYCSQACNTAGRAALQAPQAKDRARAALRLAYSEGRIVKPTGEAHHSWRGGQAAWKRKNPTAASRAADAKRLRAYRRANPDKVREFTQSRKRRQFGKLPAGALARIFAAQKGRCAICRVSIRTRRHLDHVVPLARGGEHAPRNLQYLCPPCNLTKNSRDPIDFMRSLGRLL